MKNTIITLVAMFLLFAIANPSKAESITQTIPLHPGWNAVFLEVQPALTDPAVLFTSITGLQSVWRWNPQTSTVEFIQDPDTLVPEDPQWLVYYPGNPMLTNLHAIHGETAYLIHIDVGAPDPQNLDVQGEPTIPHINWKANSFNLVGFHLDEGNLPFFDTFFSSSLAHAGQEIYTLNGGDWQEVTDPDTTSMLRGEGFWIYCHGSSEFTGPVSVQLEQGTGLHYGKILSEQEVSLRNISAAEKTLSLSLSALSETVYYWVFDPANDVAGWQEIPSPLNLTIPAGESQKLRLGVKRAGLTAESLYEANMTIADAEGMNILVPVSVTGISYSGLWVGNATITKVNEPANVNPNELFKTGSEFSLRLILHAEETGTVRLLSQVFQMWDENSSNFVVFTDDSLIPNYMPAALRDGQPVSRRISAPVFPRLPAGNAIMSGTAVSSNELDPSVGNTLSLTITLLKNDPTNPFMHRFNPEHIEPEFDTVNQEWNFPLERIFEIERAIIMTFSDSYDDKPITGVPSLGWGSTEIGGIYHEVIGSTQGFTGLHKDTLHVEGTFLLHKVSDVSTLTQ